MGMMDTQRMALFSMSLSKARNQAAQFLTRITRMTSAKSSLTVELQSSRCALVRAILTKYGVDTHVATIRVGRQCGPNRPVSTPLN